MAHKLWHTLVISSALALDACAAAAPAPLAPEAGPAEVAAIEASPSGGRAALGSGGSTSAPGAEAPRPSSYSAPRAPEEVSTEAERAAERQAAETEEVATLLGLRVCEGGWPTTKGASLRNERRELQDGRTAWLDVRGDEACVLGVRE